MAALFGDDTGEGILVKSEGREKSNPMQLDGLIQSKPADIDEGKISTGASTLNEIQERLAKAFRGTEEGNK